MRVVQDWGPQDPFTSMLLPSSFAASLAPVITSVDRLDNATVGWGNGADAFRLVPNSCGSEYCGESWSYTTPSERCSGACEDHPACRHWLLVCDTCHLLDHPGPGLRPLSSGGGGSAGSSSRAATPPTPGESVFVAVTTCRLPAFMTCSACEAHATPPTSESGEGAACMRGCMAVVSQHQCLCRAGPVLRGRLCFLESFPFVLCASSFIWLCRPRLDVCGCVSLGGGRALWCTPG